MIIENKDAQARRRELIRESKKNLTTAKQRYIFKYLIMNDERVESFTWFANNILGISANTLSRKLGGSVRFFNQVELEIIKDFFGEELLDEDRYEEVGWKVVEKSELED